MPVENKKNKLQLIVQPRVSSRNFLFEYYAYIISDIGKEDNLGKGGGVSIDKKIAKMKAIGEAIERYCGSHIFKPLVKKSFQEVKKKALDPKRIIYFHQNQYRRSFPYNCFHSFIPINWVKGYSLTNKRPILVPAFAVYMGYHRLIKKEEPNFTVTTSNGLAADKNLTKATIKAIFELVERDALMIAWYTTRRCPRLDIQSADLSDLKYLYNRILEEGYQIEICVTTLDIPIPSVIAVIYTLQKRIPFAAFGAAADCDIEKASYKALEEAILVMEVLETLNNQKKIKINSPLSVNTFLDHAIFYAQPSYKKAWNFLFKGPIYSFSKIKKMYNFLDANKLLNLKNIIKIFRKEKMEIIRINLTNKEVKNTGFKVVRVIIPELQPIDVSYKARFLGSRRILKFINLKQINKYPHFLG